MATTPYLDLAGFQQLTIAPATYVTEIETLEAGWTLRQLTHWTAWIDSQLRKRYAVPFASPYPETAINWLNTIVTALVYLKAGVDTTDAQLQRVLADADTAKAEVLQAADAVNGRWELPLRADQTASGVSKGGPLAYGEASPYVWTTLQRDRARYEDSQ